MAEYPYYHRIKVLPTITAEQGHKSSYDNHTLQSALSNSNFLEDRKNARITENSIYRDSSYKGFC